jgi:alkylhydroperoxidase family enzyme
MPRINVPEGSDPLMHLWTAHAPALATAAGAFSDAVYRRHTLAPREFEAARITIAQVNGCQICLSLRVDDGPDESLYDAVLAGDLTTLSTREALASEFARGFATAHRAMDDELWERLHDAFSDDELVELGLCVGSWLAFGRLNQVFGVDVACQVPTGHGTAAG